MAKNIKLTFILIFCSACFVFVFATFNQQHSINDSLEYQSAAKNLIKNNSLYAGETNETLDYRLFSKRTAGFPFYLIFQHISPWVVELASVFLLLLNYFFGLHLVNRLTKNRKTSRVYSWLYLLHVPLLLHTSFMMADLLLTTVVCLAVFVYYQVPVLRSKKIKILSALWCLGLLIKPVLLPSIVASPVLFLYLKYKHQRFFSTTLFPVVVVLLFSYFNKIQTGVFEYSSISTINLGQYNSKLLISEKFGYDSAQSYAQRKEFKTPRNRKAYIRYSTELKSLALETISSNLLSYTKIHMLGSVKMFLDPGRFELFTFLGIKPSAFSLTEMVYAKDWKKLKTFMFSNLGVLFVFVGLFLIAVFKLISFVFSFHEIKKHGFVVLIFLYFLAIVGPVGAARFLLPVSVFYLVFCSVGWTKLLNFFQKGSES